MATDYHSDDKTGVVIANRFITGAFAIGAGLLTMGIAGLITLTLQTRDSVSSLRADVLVLKTILDKQPSVVREAEYLRFVAQHAEQVKNLELRLQAVERKNAEDRR